jgi:hypothetical protein
MKKARLPLPVMILISATLFLVSSTLGEWISGRSSSLRTPPNETVEQQQAAVFYLRVMSWFSRVLTHPSARAEDKIEFAQPVELIKPPTRGVAAHNLQTCALDKPSRPSTRLRKSSCRTLSRPQQSESSRAAPTAAGESRDSSLPASGS